MTVRLQSRNVGQHPACTIDRGLYRVNCIGNADTSTTYTLPLALTINEACDQVQPQPRRSHRTLPSSAREATAFWSCVRLCTRYTDTDLVSLQQCIRYFVCEDWTHSYSLAHKVPDLVFAVSVAIGCISGILDYIGSSRCTATPFSFQHPCY